MKNLRIKNIQRNDKIDIRVNGETIPAYDGETILAALTAAGIRSIKKSAVTKENRGAFCGMGVCFECTAVVNGVPNVRTCMCQVENNMEIECNGQPKQAKE